MQLYLAMAFSLWFLAFRAVVAVAYYPVGLSGVSLSMTFVVVDSL